MGKHWLGRWGGMVGRSDGRLAGRSTGRMVGRSGVSSFAGFCWGHVLGSVVNGLGLGPFAFLVLKMH